MNPDHDNIPTICIVGRPNVGKSSLFNLLSPYNKAIISSKAGSTLDNKEILTEIDGVPFKLFDTAGYMTKHALSTYEISQELAHKILEKSTLILFVVDNTTGLVGLDFELIKILRKYLHVWVVANKVDHDHEIVSSDFYQIGIKNIVPISCETKYQLKAFKQKLKQMLSDNTSHQDAVTSPGNKIRVSLIGKPNAGKSTLTNILVGEHVRMVSDIPGTTRDTSEIEIKVRDTSIWLHDTAGIRRKKKINDDIEKDAIDLAIKSIKQSHICVFLIRLDMGISDQDIKLIELSKRTNQGIVIAISQCDRDYDEMQKEDLYRQLERILPTGNKPIEISTLRPKTINKLLDAIHTCSLILEMTFTTSQLTHCLNKMTTIQPPPRTHVSRIQCRFAHPGKKPREIVICGKQVESLPVSYKRYLENGFVKFLNLQYVNVSLRFKNDNNPYV